MTGCRKSHGGLVFAVLLVVGCGAGQKALVQPSGAEPVSSAPAKDEPQDPDSLEATLLDQEAVIVRELLPPATSDSVEAEAAVPSSEPPADHRPSPAACTTACKALASMRRAAEGICRLTEDATVRCERARHRVSRASERVSEAGCVCEP